MNKTIGKIKRISIVIVLMLLVTPIVYGVTIKNKEDTASKKEFFEVASREIAKDETVVMTLNLSTISYPQFQFVLSCNSDVKQVVTEQSETVKVQKDDNNLVVTGNKEEMSIQQLQLYYQVPSTVTVGDTITFKASISPIANDEKEEQQEQNQLENTVEQENTEQEDLTQTIEITVKVVESKKEEESQAPKEENKEETKQESVITTENAKKEESQIKVTTTSKTTNSTVTGNAQTEAVVYEGSYDNYLTAITVEGYSITPEFPKTNHTYFLQVANEVTAITIAVEKSDDSASVQVYGNTDLQVGENKVLISVTAENGSVRTYRIYVTKAQ